MKDQVSHIMISFLNELTYQIQRGSREVYKRGTEKEYEYIAYRNYELLIEQLLAVMGYLLDQGNWSPKFIDVGCGAGLITHLADTIGFDGFGIELRQEYVDYAKRFDVCDHLNIFKGDAFDHSYKKYDVVYYYCPINDRELQTRLEKHIEGSMKKGAFLIPKYKQGWRVQDTWDQYVIPKNFSLFHGKAREKYNGLELDNCVFQKK